MMMMSLRFILVLCCSLQLGCLGDSSFSNVCPPEFPLQYGMSICFGINEEYLTFDEAQASCIAKGAKLAEPRSGAQEVRMHFIPYPENEYHGYWFGIIGTADPGVWTYATDHSPLVSIYSFQRNFPPPGNYCIMNKYNRTTRASYRAAPCEEKARSICQYEVPMKVCGLRKGGELIPFNTSYTMQYVRMPCDYTLASIVCGDYDVRVYGTSAAGKSMTTFTPISARVVVQRALTQETLVSAQVSLGTIAKSTDGKNLWTLTDGAWSEDVSEAFEPARQAAVIKIGDVGQVDFSASNDNLENGMYVRCKDVRSSVEFPGSLCGFIDGTSNWTKIITDTYLPHEGKITIFMRAIALQNAGYSEQLQCSEIARKVRSCPNEAYAVRLCSAVFLYSPLTTCVQADKVWFERCLDAVCQKDVDRCNELKTKMADCGLKFSRRVPRVIRYLVAFLNNC